MVRLSLQPGAMSRDWCRVMNAGYMEFREGLFRSQRGGWFWIGSRSKVGKMEQEKEAQQIRGEAQRTIPSSAHVIHIMANSNFEVWDI